MPQYLGQQVQFIAAVAADGKELPLIYNRLLKPFFGQRDDIQYIFCVVQKDQPFLGDLYRPRGAFKQLRVQLLLQ